jgi:hypothetical protein
MENIAAYLKVCPTQAMCLLLVVNEDLLTEHVVPVVLQACVQLGLSAYDCFNTVDLYEEKDINVVRFPALYSGNLLRVKSLSHCKPRFLARSSLF